MARFLFVVPPLEGHVNPSVCVAGALTARGHETAWVGHPGVVAPLLPPGAGLFPLDDGLPEPFYREKKAAADRVRGLASVRFVFEDFFLPLARAMVPGVADAVQQFDPHVIVADQQALAGMIVARQRNLPWATSSTTAAGVTDPFAGLPKVRAWLEDQLAGLAREFGLDPTGQLRDLSPHLVMVFSSRELVGESHAFPEQVRFVGPALGDRPESCDFPWQELRDPPRLLVTLGTVNVGRGRDFFRTVAEAFADSAYQVILVAPQDAIPFPPRNFLVRQRIPQLAVLSHVQAVLCHAGQNTVAEALSHALPLVLMPIKDDQPVIAQQVVDAGAGLRLRFGRTSAAKIRASVDRVLAEPGFRRAAGRIRDSFRTGGGAAAAALHLERLL